MGIRDTREKHLAYLREYYRRNKQRAIDRTNEWRKKNPDRLKKIQAKRREFEKTINWKSEPKYIYSVLKDNSKSKGRKFPLGKQDFISWYEKAVKICIYCGVGEETIRKNGYARFEIDRIESSVPYQIGNIALACYFCNRVKREILTAEEARKVGQIVIKDKWKNICG